MIRLLFFRGAFCPSPRNWFGLVLASGLQPTVKRHYAAASARGDRGPPGRRCALSSVGDAHACPCPRVPSLTLLRLPPTGKRTLARNLQLQLPDYLFIAVPHVLGALEEEARAEQCSTTHQRTLPFPNAMLTARTHVLCTGGDSSGDRRAAKPLPHMDARSARGQGEAMRCVERERERERESERERERETE